MSSGGESRGLSERRAVGDKGPATIGNLTDLFLRTRAKLLRFARRRAGPGARIDVEDIVHDAFVDCLKKVDQLHSGTLRGYLFGVVRNKLLRANSRKSTLSASSLETDLNSFAGHSSDAAEVETKEFVRLLTLEEKKVMYLRLCGYSNKKIASRIRKSVRTVYNLRRRIKEKGSRYLQSD